MLHPSEKSTHILAQLKAFMSEHIYPNEVPYRTALHEAEDRFASMPLMDALKDKAKAAGLWNLFVPPEFAQYSDHGGMSFLDYAPLAEEMGRVIWSPEAFTCNAPDTGNMEVFMKFGTEAQKRAWLEPLLSGDIRSSYAMTEPQVASSDATNIELQIRRDGDEWVLNGHKWFITGAPYERCKIFIVMGKSAPNNANRHLQQSQILVPKETPGVDILRPLTTLGYDDAPIGHAEVTFTDVRVPVDNLLLGEGRGFDIAQSRLAPGRMHHCMRLIGAGQRSLELACQRVEARETFGKKLSELQSIRENIARSYAELEMARLLVHKTCWHIDTYGVKPSIELISATKITIPKLIQYLIDRCMQMYGAGGLTEDWCMAEQFNYARWCRQADGPDEVHEMALGKRMIRQYAELN